jgi:hypothetical protein
VLALVLRLKTFDHFSARFEPGRRAGKRNSGGNRLIVGRKLRENWDFREQNAAVAVVNDPCSGIAAKQPN